MSVKNILTVSKQVLNISEIIDTDGNTDIRILINNPENIKSTITRYYNDKLLFNYLDDIQFNIDILVIESEINEGIFKYITNGYIINKTNMKINIENSIKINNHICYVTNNVNTLNNIKNTIDTNVTNNTINTVNDNINNENRKADDNRDITYYKNSIKFCIIIPTYHRENKKTPCYLRKSLESIRTQKYKNWDIIVVGDKYEPEQELLDILIEFNTRMFSINKLIYLKNDNPEREYILNKKLLWNIAGANSVNIGLKYARENNYKYYCHLDDDDYWSNEHLMNLFYIYNRYPNCVFANTRSTYGKIFLPRAIVGIFPNNITPCGGVIIHSSFSFRLDIINLNYFTTHNELEIKKPSDLLMLNSINDFIKLNTQYVAVYISDISCFHDEEGGACK